MDDCGIDSNWIVDQFSYLHPFIQVRSVVGWLGKMNPCGRMRLYYDVEGKYIVDTVTVWISIYYVHKGGCILNKFSKITDIID